MEAPIRTSGSPPLARAPLMRARADRRQPAAIMFFMLPRCVGVGATFLVLAFLPLGCSSPYKPFDSAAHLREQYAQGVGTTAATQLVVPFELDEATRAALPRT